MSSILRSSSALGGLEVLYNVRLDAAAVQQLSVARDFKQRIVIDRDGHPGHVPALKAATMPGQMTVARSRFRSSIIHLLRSTLE